MTLLLKSETEKKSSLVQLKKKIELGEIESTQVFSEEIQSQNQIPQHNDFIGQCGDFFYGQKKDCACIS